ncbi:MAG: CoA-binding protein [Acidimicrobiia bacterium]
MTTAPEDTSAVARRILESHKTFAIVGCSPDSTRPSHRVAAFLQSQGYRVIPVNPNATEILGERSHPDLASAAQSEKIQVVDIFRRSEFAGRHVDEAIAIGANAVWLQLGIIDEDAADRARRAGLDVVMNRCTAIEYATQIESA